MISCQLTQMVNQASAGFCLKRNPGPAITSPIWHHSSRWLSGPFTDSEKRAFSEGSLTSDGNHHLCRKGFPGKHDSKKAAIDFKDPPNYEVVGFSGCFFNAITCSSLICLSNG